MNKLLLAGAIALAISLSYLGTYTYGKSTGMSVGKAEVYAEWDTHEAKRTKEILELQQKLNKLQAAHTAKQLELENELALANADFEKRLSGYRDEYAARVQQSNDRAELYKRRANGSATERDNLVRHAAELDRTLEEGRSLVRELGETLRQREITIRALGGIILNDRTLLESK